VRGLRDFRFDAMGCLKIELQVLLLLSALLPVVAACTRAYTRDREIAVLGAPSKLTCHLALSGHA
jgi:hypothetical protein